MRALRFLIVALLASPGITACDPANGYEEEILAWREGRMERLMSDTGYLALAGLFWLQEGESTFGSDPSNALSFPAHSAPAKAGVFIHENGVTSVRAYPGTPLLHDGEPVVEMRMAHDGEENTTLLTLGDLSFYVINRSDRYAIRMRDLNSEIRKSFRGIDSYPIDAAYRVTARFEPYEPAKRVPIVNEVGTVDTMLSPGALVFELLGEECRLDPVVSSLEAQSYFLIFRDATTGVETYDSGRFLYTDLPVDGEVIVDFNKAYNPPCAFSPYTTCPLPPLQNDLKVSVRAGEKRYAGEAKPGHSSSSP
jgi:uncharacterized protein (DUF1684 family)